MMSDITIRSTTSDDAELISQLMRQHCGGEPLIVRTKEYYPSKLDGIIAERENETIGFLFFDIQSLSCEIVVFEVFDKFHGIGSKIIEKLKPIAKEKGCNRIYLMTNNDNLDALRFYQRRGFHICNIHLDSVKESRKIKPGIPMTGEYGIPLRDEIDLELILDQHWKASNEKQNNFIIKKLDETDIGDLANSFCRSEFNKPASLFAEYFAEQKGGNRIVWVAISSEKYIGYVTLVWKSQYKPFATNKIPEIKDLNVLTDYRKQGVASALLDIAERCAFEKSKNVGIGVGLYKDYGNAQRLYYARGYKPDGEGITYNYQPINPGQSVQVDDDLCLWFIKGPEDLSYETN